MSLLDRLVLDVHQMIFLDAIPAGFTDHRADDRRDSTDGQERGDRKSSHSRQGQAKSQGKELSEDRGMTSGERKDRDDLIRFSVMRLRMTVPQIMEFSKMWLHPFSDEANVWRRLRKLRLHPATTRGITLDKKVMHVHRQSRHDEDTIRLCLKIWGDASRNKIRITEIDREKPVGYQSGIRPDMAFRLNGYLYYVEVQRSSMTFRGWKTKLGKYRTFRKKKETKPFRTIVVMEDQRDLNTAYRYGKEVMQKHPDLCLFYFGWLPDILGQYDVCTEDVWVTNRLIDFNGVFSDEGKPEVIPLVL